MTQVGSILRLFKGVPCDYDDYYCYYSGLRDLSLKYRGFRLKNGMAIVTHATEKEMGSGTVFERTFIDEQPIAEADGGHSEDVMMRGVEGHFGGVGSKDTEKVGGAFCGCIGGERHGIGWGDRRVFGGSARCEEGQRVKQTHTILRDDLVLRKEGRHLRESDLRMLSELGREQNASDQANRGLKKLDVPPANEISKSRGRRSTSSQELIPKLYFYISAKLLPVKEESQTKWRVHTSRQTNPRSSPPSSEPSDKQRRKVGVGSGEYGKTSLQVGILSQGSDRMYRKHYGTQSSIHQQAHIPSVGSHRALRNV
ncbi:uncharacterized protein EV420DRAFT_1472291 [Desarmillaria tabescens]|uniref:Uncharacterized protein n=1 Tax=Armillaria tabescens TaxID=1929756 RepID=A0AA39NNU0_ARMTA|nr:uncharacterized protein EV420DRAFT_1472291 [Desarmillaria tabescens]KAK0468980.1 hypothetical protein EV420DRAFT_1472291 [Desarmillaria tabescens]